MTIFTEGTTSAGLYLREAGDLRFATNSIDRMRIDSSGDVGIGTDTPSGKLDVQNGADRAIKFEVDGTTGDNHIKSYQGTSENVRNLRITGQDISVDTNSSSESEGINRVLLRQMDTSASEQTRPKQT